MRTDHSTNIDILTNSPKLEHTALVFSVGVKFDPLTSDWVRRRTLLEVAPLPPERFLSEAGRQGHKVKVHMSPSIQSRLVAELRPHCLLRIVGTQEMNDGSKRALVVLPKADSPLGWITARTSEGEVMVHIYARPLYEVLARLEVLKSFDESSTLVRDLEAGERVHVLESRRTSNGCQRVAVRVLGEQSVLGWCVAIRADGKRMLVARDPETTTVEMQQDMIKPRTPRTPRAPQTPRTPRTPSTGASSARHAAPSQRNTFTASASMRRSSPSTLPTGAPSTERSSRSTSSSRSQDDSARGAPTERSSRSTSSSRSQDDSARGAPTERSSRSSSTPRQRSTPRGSARGPSPWRSQGPSRSHSQHPFGTPPRGFLQAVTFASAAPAAEQAWCGSTTARAKAVTDACNGGSSSIPVESVEANCAAPMPTAKLSPCVKRWQYAYRMISASVSTFRSLKALSARVDRCAQQIRDGEVSTTSALRAEIDELHPGFKDSYVKREKFSAVELAHELRARPRVIETWGEVGSTKGRLTRAEFIESVRALEVPTLSTNDALITTLFDTLVESSRAEVQIDVAATLKPAMKNVFDGSPERTAEISSWKAACARCDAFSETLDAMQTAEAATLRLQKAYAEIERMRAETPMGARLGTLFIRKGLKVADLVEQWDEAGTGEIVEDDFVHHCIAIGMESTFADGLRELFRALDDDGGGSLDKQELRQALKSLEVQAYEARQISFDLYKRTLELHGTALDAQKRCTELKEQHKKEIGPRGAKSAWNALKLSGAALRKLKL